MSSSGSFGNWWNSVWFAGQYSVENLGLIRIWMGFSLIILNFSQFISLVTIDVFGPSFHYIEPIWYFDLLGIDRVSPLMNYVGFFLLQIACITMMLGYKTRISIITIIICIFYLKGVRDSAAGDVHHRYLMWINVLLMLLISRSNEILSLDGLKGALGKRPIEAWEAHWPIKMMQVYVCFFYFFSAVAKVRVSGLNWVMDGTPIQKMLLTKTARWNFESLPLASMMVEYPLINWFAVLFTLAFEFGFPLILLAKSLRTRIIFFSGVTIFHVSNTILAGVGFWSIPLLFLIFFDMKKVVARFPKLEGLIYRLHRKAV